MAALDELKSRVDHMGDVMDVLASNYNRLTDMVGKHDEQMAEMRRQTAELRQQTAEMRQQTAELRTMSSNAQKQLDNHQQQLIEMRRDSQKTRRLWIAMSQKLDWLDLDEDFD